MKSKANRIPITKYAILLPLISFPFVTGAVSVLTIKSLPEEEGLLTQTSMNELAALVRDSDVDGVKCFFSRRPFTKDCFNIPDYNLLGLASSREMAELLLSRGANVNRRYISGATVLHLVLLNRHNRVAELLVERGADIHCRSVNGVTPLMAALADYGYSGSLETVEYLLKKGARVNEANKAGWTPLHFAVHIVEKEIVKLLLDCGADPEARDINGITPYGMALNMSEWEIAEMLEASYDRRPANVERFWILY